MTVYTIANSFRTHYEIRCAFFYKNVDDVATGAYCVRTRRRDVEVSTGWRELVAGDLLVPLPSHWWWSTSSQWYSCCCCWSTPWRSWSRHSQLHRPYTQPSDLVLYQPLDAHCCYMGTAIKHLVSDRVKPSFAIFDIRALWRSWLSVRVPGCQKWLQMTA